MMHKHAQLMVKGLEEVPQGDIVQLHDRFAATGLDIIAEAALGCAFHATWPMVRYSPWLLKLTGAGVTSTMTSRSMTSWAAHWGTLRTCTRPKHCTACTTQNTRSRQVQPS